MSPRVALGSFGILLLVVGSFLASLPGIARVGIVKQLPPSSRSGAERIFLRTLIRVIGIGQMLLGLALVMTNTPGAIR